jgi:hypothetical protein
LGVCYFSSSFFLLQLLAVPCLRAAFFFLWTYVH